MARLNPQQQAYLDAMGVTVWVSQSSPELSVTQPIPESPIVVAAQTASVPVLEDWTVLEQAVKQCQRCDLHKTRTQTVFGVGNRQAELMVIGEAPGADEDRQGEPFVGRAGQLLNEMLKAIGLQRQQVYIANILKCRPPNNRDPKPEEAAQCSAYLFQQIALVKPRLILAVGRIAAQRLLKTDTALGRMRGKVHQHPETGVPLIVTYHPAYLLRTPADKRKAWEDLLFLRKTIKSD
ncbi:MAG: uracil-DNA glycosylase [Gammaproteobacteria bacterium]|nr:uracil-DNA glycosylase [Gammaproteobacteria bacterium]